MQRIYDAVIKEHLANYKQMLFLAGPRQVGKTTMGLRLKKDTTNFSYLNWDNQDHRNLIIQGTTALASSLKLDRLQEKKAIIIFDELHKYSKWKNFLKGFFDTYKDKTNLIVTGSSRLNIFKRGGDSLMGRYFLYRIHPISVAECLTTTLSGEEISQPKIIKPKIFQALFNFGGFPEPFLKQEKRFLIRWKRLRKEQLFYEDIRDLSKIQEIAQLELLAILLHQQVGQLMNFANLANKVNVSTDTIRRWLGVLKAFYYCFTIKPWTKNITRSLLKAPKVYLWDWSDVEDIGFKAENFVASHLLKAVHFWSDYGFGDYELYFLRDKEKREVDFLVTKDNKPWFLVEVKYNSNAALSSNLAYFQKSIGAKHAFQVVFNEKPIMKDCFSHTEPIIVPAQTLLSQLV